MNRQFRIFIRVAIVAISIPVAGLIIGAFFGPIIPVPVAIGVSAVIVAATAIAAARAKKSLSV